MEYPLESDSPLGPLVMPGDSKSHSSLCYHRIFWDAGDVNAEPGFDWYDDSGVAIGTRWNLQHL